jgi:hypothetical protein
MGSETQGFEEGHLYTSKEEMGNLMLDDPLNNTKSYLNYQSTMSSSMISETHHPLSP